MNSCNALSARHDDEFTLKFVHPNNKEKSNIEKLGLSQLYNEHKDYVMDIFEKAVSYNDDYKKALLNSFQTSGYCLMCVHDFVWGIYNDTAQQEKRPLSILTRDLLEQMG